MRWRSGACIDVRQQHGGAEPRDLGRPRQRQRHDAALRVAARRELRGLRRVLAEHQARRDARPTRPRPAAPRGRRGRTARARDWRSRSAAAARPRARRAGRPGSHRASAASPAARTARGDRSRRGRRRRASAPCLASRSTYASSADRKSSNGAPFSICCVKLPDEPNASATVATGRHLVALGELVERELEVRGGRHRGRLRERDRRDTGPRDPASRAVSSRRMACPRYS